MKQTCVALIAILILLVATAASATTTFTVSNANDSGPGSLRDAITQANATPGDDFIRFEIGSGTVVLAPGSPYPATVGKIAIDGSAQANGAATPAVVIDASNLFAPAFQLSASSSLGHVTISGDHAAAIDAGDGVFIGQCLIGTNPVGSGAIANAIGIVVTGPGVRLSSNTISGNAIGVQIQAGGIGAQLYANHIGQSASGTTAVPNGVGIDVVGNGTSAGLEIGLAGLPNTISGNTGAAIRVASFNSVTILGNYIGTIDFFGKPLGNGAGIELNGSNASITENTIANNSGTAIWIGGGTHNKISQNSIARNGFGIDLGDTRNGHTANDSLDADSGPNGLLNHPVIASAVQNFAPSTTTVTITGSFSSAPNTAYSIELYADSTCAGDYTTAESYLTTLSVSTDGSGNATFSHVNSFLPVGSSVSAIAIDAQNNSSEISNCSVVTTHGTFGFPQVVPTAQETDSSLTVTIIRTAGSAGVATIDYTTATPAPQTGFYNATPGADYGPVSGTLTFADGETSKTITIPIFNDNLYESSENFNIVLSNPTGGAIVNPLLVTSRAVILDDEPASKISIADASVIEGNSGITTAHVPVSLSTPADFPITVSFKVGSDESATAGDDYQPISGSITFAPGDVLKTIDVPVFGDTKYELDEVFGVSLQTVTADRPVEIVNFGAHCKIVNDDVGKVTCTPASATVLEGGAGTFTNIEITCTPDSPFAGGVRYVTADGTAKAGEADYQFSSGSVVFNPGFGASKFTIPVIGDDVIEKDEQFTIKLTAEPAPPWNFVVEPATITVTILNDDTPGVVTCRDLGAIEGNSGLNNAAISCSSPSRITGTIDYATHDGTATAPLDYHAVSGTLTFNDETSKTIFIPIVGDTAVEPDEQFTVTLTAHVNELKPFSVAQDSVTVTIPNDDEPAPSAVVVLAPSRLVSKVGETTAVRATLDPPSDKATMLTLVALDSSIVDVPNTIALAPGEPAVFPVMAKKTGSTMITVSAGSGTGVAVLVVDVTAGSASLASLEPNMATVAGGVNVTLHGTNLSAGCSVSFGAVHATSATFINATTAIATAPPHAEGSVDVVLTCGSTTSILEKRFTYVPGRGRAARH